MTAWASSVIALPRSVPVNESHHRGPSRVSRDGSERWGCGGHVGAPTSIGGLWLALALLPARTRVDGLEPALGREIPRPHRVLLAVPADLGHHAGGEHVLPVLALHALVVDDELLGAHLGFVGRFLQRGRLDRLRAVDDVGHPQEAGDLAHRQLAHVLAAAVLLVDLVDLLPRRPLVYQVD